MTGSTGSTDQSQGASDNDMFVDIGRRLADVIEAALPAWVERSVVLRAGPQAASSAADVVADVGHRAATEVGGRLRELLMLGIDEQWTNPLSIVRSAVRYPTEVLKEMGVPPQDRDHFAASQDPDDVYALTPAAFADFGPDVHEQGIMWGAAKAHLHLQRRRSEHGSPRSEVVE